MSERLARRVSLGSLLLAACAPEAAMETSWMVSFACGAEAELAHVVQVAISPGTCAMPSEPIYRETIQRGDVNGSAAPPSLTMGNYAFSAIAYDERGAVISTTCRDVALPSSQGVLLELPSTQGCDLPSPSAEPTDVTPPRTGGGPVTMVPSMPTADASMPTADAGMLPDDAGMPPDDPVQDAGVVCGDFCQVTTIYSSPTKDISLPKECWAPGEVMPVTILIPVTAKDWLWVKNHPDYGGSDQEFWDHTGITTAGAVYRGGEREPSGLHAPTTPGAFTITWHQNDASDKEVHSKLAFTVSATCP